MPSLTMGLIGCGGMGLRYVYGLNALALLSEKVRENISIELVAVCDPNQANARYIAEQSEQILGARPQIFADQAEMLGKYPNLESVSITTATGSHHTLAVEALNAGKHVLVEKPLAATIKGCNLVLSAAEKSGKVLAVAENIRRDPKNRLTLALLQDGAIGRPYLIVDYMATGGSAILLTAWRHQKETGGIMLDVAVHDADLMRYFLGDIEQVSGCVRLLEKERFRSDEPVVASETFYQNWLKDLPKKISATAEDLLVGHFEYSSGVVGQWTIMQAAHADKRNMRLIYGSKGVLEFPPDRSDKKLVLRRFDSNEAISGDQLLAFAPSYQLDLLTAALFKTSPVSFEEVDERLVAIELWDFAKAVLCGQKPEVDGYEARKAIALVYAFFESDKLGRKVTLTEIEQDNNSPYQAEVNQILGIA